MNLNTIKNFFRNHPTLAWGATAIVFPPLGAYGVWKYTNCRKGIKVALSIYAAIYTLGVVSSALTNPPESRVSTMPFVTPSPSVTPSPLQSSMQLSCEDFNDQADAQESFDNGNRFHLEDNDGDGIACEETIKYNSQKIPQELFDKRQSRLNSEDKATQYVSAIEEKLKQFPIEDQDYGLGVLAAWTSDDTNLQAAYKSNCEAVRSGEQWVNNPESTAQYAYEANERRFPLNQLEAWYKARSQAIKEVACD